MILVCPDWGSPFQNGWLAKPWLGIDLSDWLEKLFAAKMVYRTGILL